MPRRFARVAEPDRRAMRGRSLNRPIASTVSSVAVCTTAPIQASGVHAGARPKASCPAWGMVTVARKQSPRGQTTLSGLGQRHRVNREKLLRALVDGSPCPGGCGNPIYRDPARNHDHRPLHADHWPIPRAIAGPHALASRLICATCNLAAGGRLRAELAGERVSDAEPDRTGLVFAWP